MSSPVRPLLTTENVREHFRRVVESESKLRRELFANILMGEVMRLLKERKP